MWKTPHAKADAYEDHDHIKLHWIETKNEHKGQGHGKTLLQHITKYADKVGKPVHLSANPELHAMYGKHGFVAHDRHAMIRPHTATASLKEHQIALKDIKEISPRDREHERVMYHRRKLRNGEKLDPIVVIPNKHGPQKWKILDGHHRYAAHDAEGKTHINTVITK